MDGHRVFIVGGSLFAEILAQMLATRSGAGAVNVIGAAPTLEAALPLLETNSPDAVIVTGSDETAPAIFGPLLAAFPDLPLIRADLGANQVQVITSQRVAACSSDLLAAIAALPKRN
jgi:DNA-binding NarL/FixJ family response regulator